LGAFAGRAPTGASEWLSGSPWPTFNTGRPAQDHGIYHHLQWRPDLMSMRRPTPDWLPAPPFWRDLGSPEARVIALDMPMGYAPRPFAGLEISGWTSHDSLVSHATYPPSLAAWLRREYGMAPMRPEAPGLKAARALLAVRDDLRARTAALADVAVRLMGEQPWQLCLLTFGAPHRGGHQLWDRANLSDQPDATLAETLAEALREVYVACDGAVGRLLEAVGAEVPVLVFSLHGMGPNTSRVEILPALLERILNGGPPGNRGLAAARRQVPLAWRHALTRRLPIALQDRLMTFWRLGGVDWSSSLAVSLMADLHGYVRINRRGRERRGVVEPGAPFEALCRRIADGLASFVDADSGEPIVATVGRTDRLLAGGERTAGLPDLIVRWSDRPARHRAVRSPTLGSVAWPTPGRHPDGRSGNHRAEGFLIAAGPAQPQGIELPPAHIVDLAPSIRALLGLPAHPAMTGRSLIEQAVVA
jgi:predicted AlkP superfamily phosphohydrolase/phosphomutase